MKIDDVLEGITILRRYSQSEYPFAAEHDTLYFGTSRPLSEEDNRRVRELGWMRDEDPIDEDEGEGVPTPEDEYGSSWYAYV